MTSPTAGQAVMGFHGQINHLQAVVPQLCDLLRDRIIRGDLLPGFRITRTEIAAHYGVSRQPVSEACVRLSDEALVDIRPQRGTFVSRIGVRAVMSARFVREAVEADVVRLLAARPCNKMLDKCEELLRAQRAETHNVDPRPFMVLDEAFHRHLAKSAGQAASWDILQPLKTQMDRMRYLTARQFPRELLLEQHGLIVAGLRAGDAQAAEAAMRGHLRQVLNDLPNAVEAHPSFFDTRGMQA